MASIRPSLLGAGLITRLEGREFESLPQESLGGSSNAGVKAILARIALAILELVIVQSIEQLARYEEGHIALLEFLRCRLRLGRRYLFRPWDSLGRHLFNAGDMGGLLLPLG